MLITLCSDYVSAVVGIFIVFVSMLWLFKRKSYDGPASPHLSPTDMVHVHIRSLLTLRFPGLRHDYHSLAARYGSYRIAFLGIAIHYSYILSLHTTQ